MPDNVERIVAKYTLELLSVFFLETFGYAPYCGVDASFKIFPFGSLPSQLFDKAITNLSNCLRKMRNYETFIPI